jgi:malonate transporter
MVSVLLIILPVFALIFAGWSTRRIGVLGPHATSELNRFVVYLALPALLFDIVVNARWAEIWQPGFIGAFGLGSGLIFVATIAIRMRQSRHLADAAVDGLNTAYANTGFIGFPLALAIFGPVSLAPTLIASIFTVCVLFAAALVIIEIGLQTEKHPARMVRNVVLSLARNPLLLAPALAAFFLLFGIKMPHPAESFLKLLGGAASPCALVALGLFLGEKRHGAWASLGVTGLLVALKLIGQPLLTAGFGQWAFHLHGPTLHMAVLMAALPTGTGPFMVAEFYRREANITANVVLASTIGSIATIAAYLSAVAAGYIP